MIHNIKFLAPACMALAFSVGCGSLPKTKPMEMPLISKDKEKKEKEIDFGVPETMAVIWTDSICTLPGKPTTRGFGGRFFFYDAKGETIPVDGEMTIYGFDDSDNLQQRKVADRKFIFRPDELQRHASENDLGTSYSFWVPWDEAGGYRTTVSLLPMFKAADGKLVRGEMSVNVLPGKPPETAESQASNGMKVPYADPAQFGNRQVGFTERVDRGYQSLDDGELNRTQMKTSTIAVPRDLGRQMQSPQAARKPRAENKAAAETPVTRLQIEQQAPPGGNVQVGTGPAPGFHNQGRPRKTLNTTTGSGF